MRSDDQGISSVLGTILVVGLLIISLVTIQTTFVPVWEETSEASRMGTVGQQMADISGLLGEMSTTSNVRAVSVALGSAERRTGMFAQPRTPHQVSFEPQPDGSTQDVTVYTPNLTVVTTGEEERVATGLNPEWRTVDPGEEVDGILRVDSLRLRLSEVGRDYRGDAVRLELRDDRGRFAGSFRFYIGDHPSGYSLNTRVRQSDGTILVDQGVAAFQQKSFSPYWVDVLTKEWLFDQVIASASPKPLTLHFEVIDGSIGGAAGSLSAEYAIAFREQTGGGEIIEAAGGETLAPFERTFSGGRISYEGLSNHFPDQAYLSEHGGIVLEQSQGTVFRAPPTLEVSQVSNRTQVTLQLSSLIGPSVSTSTTSTVQVNLRSTVPDQLVGLAPQWSTRVTTDHPDLWRSFLRQQLLDAGLSGQAGEFSIDAGPDYVNATIFGETSDPSSSVRDVEISLRHVPIVVEVRG